MFTKVSLALCSAVVAAVLNAAPAHAEEGYVPNVNGITVEGGFSQGRLLPDYGIYIMPEKTIVDTSITYTTHDHFTFAWNTYTEASTQGKYGCRGMGDEQQLAGIYHDSNHTRFGTFEYQGSLTYRFLDMGKCLTSTSDDFVDIAGQIAYPIHLGGSWKLTPRIGIKKSVGVGPNNPMQWDLGAIRLDGPVLSDARFYADFVSVHNNNSETAAHNKNTWDVVVAVEKPLWGTVLGTIGFTYAQYANRDKRFEYRPTPDGRLDPFLREEKDWTRPGAKIFGTLRIWLK